MNTAMLRGSANFCEFIDLVKTKRDEELERFKGGSNDQLAQARDRYNAFDEVVNLLDEIDAEAKAFAGERDDEE